MDSQYLLLVEDDPMVQANNKKILERRGYTIGQAFTLSEARAIMAQTPPHAIVLDLQLPDGNGLDFLWEIRETSTVPVLMLTALSTPTDVIKGLEAGGDTYLPKPYELNVFLAHIEALLRRAANLPETVIFGPFTLDPANHIAYLNGENMSLAPKEFSLLLHFIRHPGTAFSADYLYEKVWRQPMHKDAGAVKNQIYNLRKKLADSGYTVSAERGEGYCFGQQ